MGPLGWSQSSLRPLRGGPSKWLRLPSDPRAQHKDPGLKGIWESLNFPIGVFQAHHSRCLDGPEQLPGNVLWRSSHPPLRWPFPGLACTGTEHLGPPPYLSGLLLSMPPLECPSSSHLIAASENYHGKQSQDPALQGPCGSAGC